MVGSDLSQPLHADKGPRELPSDRRVAGLVLPAVFSPEQAFWLVRGCTASEFRHMRRALGMTQVELGKLIDMSPESVCRIEKGNVEINRCAEILLRCMYCEAHEISVTVRGMASRLAHLNGEAQQ